MAENINDNEKSSIKDTEEAVPNSAIDNDNDNLIDGGSGLISPIRNNEENKNVINDNIEEEEEEESMVWPYILAGFLTLITSIILSIFVNAFIAFVIIPAILIIYKGISNNNKNNTIVAHKLNRKFEKETTLVQSNNQNISKQNEHSKENSLLQQLFQPIHLNNRNSDKKKDEENQLIGNNDTNNKTKDNLFKENKNDKANMDLNKNDFLKRLFSSNNHNSDKKKDEENKLENDEENKLENDEENKLENDEEKNNKTKDNLFKENKNDEANMDLKDKNKNQDKEEEKEKSI